MPHAASALLAEPTLLFRADLCRGPRLFCSCIYTVQVYNRVRGGLCVREWKLYARAIVAGEVWIIFPGPFQFGVDGIRVERDWDLSKAYVDLLFGKYAELWRWSWDSSSPIYRFLAYYSIVLGEIHEAVLFIWLQTFCNLFFTFIVCI